MADLDGQCFARMMCVCCKRCCVDVFPSSSPGIVGDGNEQTLLSQGACTVAKRLADFGQCFDTGDLVPIPRFLLSVEKSSSIGIDHAHNGCRDAGFVSLLRSCLVGGAMFVNNGPKSNIADCFAHFAGTPQRHIPVSPILHRGTLFAAETLGRNAGCCRGGVAGGHVG